MAYRFTHRILRKHDVAYHHCPACGLLQTEQPYWLEEAYDSAIARADTGLLQRNLGVADVVVSLAWFLLDPKARYVDLAGGFGVLTRLARDAGLDCYWTDKFAPNLLAKGFEAIPGAGYAVATAFEVLEHVHDPVAFLRAAMDEWGVRTILLSTEVYKDEPPAPDAWWYYAFSTGQHVSFYQARTLQRIADELRLRLYSNGNFHLLTERSFDPRFFALVTSRLSRWLAIYVRRRLTSKTWLDHQALAGGDS
jgi:hypothetical protein